MTSPIGRFAPPLARDENPEDDELSRRAAIAARNGVVLLGSAGSPLLSRCSVCSKKEYSMLMACACELLFCVKHRLSHECTVDHRGLAKAKDEEYDKAASARMKRMPSSDHLGPSGDAAF